MAIYLKKFGTMSQYNAYTADTENFILPNVSLTVDNDTVHYNQNIPPTPSHDYVEIDGIKWATMNVGANSVTDTGLYFQWGDTQGYTAAQVGCEDGKKCFVEGDYIYYNDSSYTKYNVTDGKKVLEASDDAVTAAWGGNWRMPTASEFAALVNAVNTAWTDDYQGSGVAGLICTDKTDSSKVLFFPACSFCDNGRVDAGNHGYYWSSSLGSDCSSASGHNLYFTHDEYVDWGSNGNRFNGFPIRGVVDE
jgi:hypothetical protein